MADANGASSPTTPYAAFIERRRARYTAQALEIFEKGLEASLRRAGVITPEIQAAIEEAKGIFRRKIQELATDVIDTMTLPGSEVRTNAAARELIDADHQGAATT